MKDPKTHFPAPPFITTPQNLPKTTLGGRLCSHTMNKHPASAHDVHNGAGSWGIQRA